MFFLPFISKKKKKKPLQETRNNHYGNNRYNIIPSVFTVHLGARAIVRKKKKILKKKRLSARRISCVAHSFGRCVLLGGTT